MKTIDKKLIQKCKESCCRSCGRIGLKPVLDLGLMPPSDRLLMQEHLAETEEMFPLEVAYCPNCSLVQILETVPPEKLFSKDYIYFSSFSEVLLEHSRKNVVNLIEHRGLNKDSFVVEIASNDGYLLRNYVEEGIPCLGIDPAPAQAEAAEKIGVPTLCDFFSKESAQQLVREGRRADVLHANNVVAHVADTNGFIEGMATLLKETGVAVIEVPYVRDLVDNCEFDTIYHEHLCYFSVTAIDKLLRRHHLFLNHVEHLTIHGGSLRLYAEPNENVGESVREILSEERRQGLDTYAYYSKFGDAVRDIVEQVRNLLLEIKGKGKRLAAYGAAAKGTIMLNTIGVGTDIIDFVVDRNIHKHGKYMPGVHVPICDTSRLLDEQPDYALILPWNFKDEILRQQQAYRDRGGKFIIPLPKPTIV